MDEGLTNSCEVSPMGDDMRKKETIETVIKELRNACRSARRFRGGVTASIVALNQERSFRYDGVTDQWTRV